MQESKLDLITTSLCSLLANQPNLLQLIPPTGYIEVFVNKLKSKNVNIEKASLTIIAQFCLNSMCVHDLVSTNALPTNLVESLRKDRGGDDDLKELACDILIKMFTDDNQIFIEQSIKSGLIERLLHILDSNVRQAVKVKIVQMLQSIQNNVLLGNQISDILAKSNIWKDYKDQKHDLFLTNNNQTQYLTGKAFWMVVFVWFDFHFCFSLLSLGVNHNIAGYITQSATSSLPLVPPPMED